jgi:hypothetical protein
MQKTILCTLVLALSTTLALAAEPDAMAKDSATGGTTSMQATPPKGGSDSMSSDKMSTDKMDAGGSMKADDKMKPDDKMMKSDDKMGK